MSSSTIRRGTVRRPIQTARGRMRRTSIIDQFIAALPISEAMLTRIATWSIVSVVCGAIIALLVWAGVPGVIGNAIGEGIGDAGFRVNNVQITGLHRMDQNTIYGIVLDQPSRAMPLFDLEQTRKRLVDHSGWIADAHVSRRLPDTVLVDIVERTPSAIWQKNGQLSLIADNGAVLEPVRADAMPDLPLVIGDNANVQTESYRKLLDAAPALRPVIKAATWVGNRRWNLTFESGETLLLPEGDGEAGRALVTFAQKDATHPLLGRGWLRFDMRDPAKFVARPPGELGRGMIDDANASAAPVSAPAGRGAAKGGGRLAPQQG